MDIINNLLQPVQEELRRFSLECKAWQVGASVKFSLPEAKSKNPYALVLIGLETMSNNTAVRRELYSLSNVFSDLTVYDLGDVKGGALGVAEVMENLSERNYTTILLADESNASTEGILQAFERDRNTKHILSVDNRIDFKTGEQKNESLPFINRLLAADNIQASHKLTCLGYQTYFIDPSILKYLDTKGHETLRLGKVRQSPEECEPSLRGIDTAIFNLASLKRTELPLCRQTAPSGFTTEEASRIIRYIGMSASLRQFVLLGIPDEKDDYTAQLIAQFLWFLLDGRNLSSYDNQKEKKHFTGYSLELRDYNLNLRFWKSMRTERWWLEHPQNSEKWLPCSLEDYRTAAKGELSDRLMGGIGND